jgi:hypothetical protein
MPISCMVFVTAHDSGLIAYLSRFRVFDRTVKIENGMTKKCPQSHTPEFNPVLNRMIITGGFKL